MIKSLGRPRSRPRSALAPASEPAPGSDSEDDNRHPVHRKSYYDADTEGRAHTARPGGVFSSQHNSPIAAALAELESDGADGDDGDGGDGGGADELKGYELRPSDRAYENMIQIYVCIRKFERMKSGNWHCNATR